MSVDLALQLVFKPYPSDMTLDKEIDFFFQSLSAKRKRDSLIIV